MSDRKWNVNIKSGKYNMQEDNQTGSLFFDNHRSTVVLLFHGLAGSSVEVRGLAEFLNKQGISVYAPTLTHHQSRQLEDLRKADLETWKKDARDAYDRISSFKTIIVGGISNGASLATYLALEKKAAGLISICPPVFPGFSVFKKLPLEKMFEIASKTVKYLPRFDYKMVRDWTLARSLPRFRKLPSHFPYHSLLLSRYIRDRFTEITVPTLIIQARHDNRVSPVGAKYFFNRIQSERKKLVIAEHSGHVVLLDRDREQVFKEIASFIQNL